jgi:hypothetical protein
MKGEYRRTDVMDFEREKNGGGGRREYLGGVAVPVDDPQGTGRSLTGAHLSHDRRTPPVRYADQLDDYKSIDSMDIHQHSYNEHH